MTKTEPTRLLTWRWKVLQQVAAGWTVARTCRHVGIARKTFYQWKKRDEADRDIGRCDRPRVARQSPRATSADVVRKILYLRERYHCGPGKIADYVQRFHQVTVARSTVHRIVVCHRMNRLPSTQTYQRPAKRWHRYEKPQPGFRLHVDVKFLERIPGTPKRFYQCTAIDDCTRIRVLTIFDACNQRTASRFIDEVVRRLPFRVRVVQTDNGAEFQSHVHAHLAAQEIRHVYIRPRTPHLHGTVARSHRVDDQERYQLLDQEGITDDIHLVNDTLKEWQDYYHSHRPHGARDGQTPYERLLTKTSAEPLPKV